MADRAKNISVLFTVSLLAIVSTGWSKEPTCHRCGCCKMVRECHPVATTKSVTTDYWDSATQSFCIPHVTGIGPTRRDHAKSDKGEAEQFAKADADTLCHDTKSHYAARPRHRNRLIRKKCVTRVPVIGWVTQYVCPHCGPKSGGDQPAQHESPADQPSTELQLPPALSISPSMQPSRAEIESSGQETANDPAGDATFQYNGVSWKKLTETSARSRGNANVSYNQPDAAASNQPAMPRRRHHPRRVARPADHGPHEPWPNADRAG
jgi:hypothetical protein